MDFDIYMDDGSILKNTKVGHLDDKYNFSPFDSCEQFKAEINKNTFDFAFSTKYVQGKIIREHIKFYQKALYTDQS
jgi:hypothetical protein